MFVEVLALLSTPFCNLKVKFFSESLAGVSVLTPNNCRSWLTFISASQYSHCQKEHHGE